MLYSLLFHYLPSCIPTKIHIPPATVATRDADVLRLLLGTVPTKNATNRALGRWVSTQRAVYKRFIKTGELAYPRMNIKEMNQRISRLNGLNFSWYEGIGSNNNSSNSSNDISI